MLLDELAFFYYQLINAFKDGFKPVKSFIGYYKVLAGIFIPLVEKNILKKQ